MPTKRTELHDILLDVCPNVYYQPPESVKLVYPCIVYNLNSALDLWSDGILYSTNYEYSVTLIDKDPDSSLFERIREIPGCKFDRSYRSDNLNHFSFRIHYKN